MATANQELVVRLLALGAMAAAANVPLGMWREHTKKFSPKWFLAVHASIPLVMAARKSLHVPRWAVVLSILSAVVGQQVGARLERRRLQQAGRRPPPAPAASASTAAAKQRRSRLPRISWGRWWPAS